MDEKARRVDKPWGHEKIWAHTDRYVGKVIVIDPGKRLSLQYHKVKDESILVLRGPLRLHLEGDDGEMHVHDLLPRFRWPAVVLTSEEDSGRFSSFWIP